MGEPKPGRDRVLEHLDSVLPADRPRYLMGVGTPEDLVEGVARGIDMFDCVLPTRNARNGQLFTSRGTHLDPQRPLPGRSPPARPGLPLPHLPDARAAPTCATSTWPGEMTAATLMTIHNLFYYLDMMGAMRQSIRLCRFEEWRGETLRRLAAADQDGS